MHGTITLLLVLLMVVIAVMAVARLRPRRVTRRREAPNVAWDLRRRALTMSPVETGTTISAGRPFGVIMEFVRGRAVVSVVAFGSGEASIYISTGGGVIGGGSHDAVRRAAMTLVTEAAQHMGDLEATREFPYPVERRVRFYVRTPEDVRTAETAEADLAGGGDRLSPLFVRGHELIAQLRQTSASV